MTPEDQSLFVRFYQKEVQNNFLTTENGRPIFQMVDCVRIEVPGDRLNIVDTEATEEYKKRFPIQWAQYQNEKSQGTPSDMQGTPLTQWPLLTAAQAAELKHFKFYTVEQIAASSDTQIQQIGMLTGMAPFAFRDKARAYLGQAGDSALVQKQAEELAKQNQTIADLQAQIASIASRLGDEKRGPGRPKKEPAEA